MGFGTEYPESKGYRLAANFKDGSKTYLEIDGKLYRTA